MNSSLDNRRGQVMIMTVLTLGGTLLGATTVAGLFMLYQIRQATDLANSAKAFSAADAGLEWGLYNAFCDTTKAPCPASPTVFGIKASTTVTCTATSGVVLVCDNLATRASIRNIRAVGRSANVTRALEASF